MSMLVARPQVTPADVRVVKPLRKVARRGGDRVRAGRGQRTGAVVQPVVAGALPEDAHLPVRLATRVRRGDFAVEVLIGAAAGERVEREVRVVARGMCGHT